MNAGQCVEHEAKVGAPEPDGIECFTMLDARPSTQYISSETQIMTPSTGGAARPAVLGGIVALGEWRHDSSQLTAVEDEQEDEEEEERAVRNARTSAGPRMRSTAAATDENKQLQSSYWQT